MEITAEQLNEFVKNDAGKAIIVEVAKGLGFGDTTGLVNKNKELLGEIVGVKSKYTEIEKQFEPFKGLNLDEVKTALEKFKNPEKFKDDDPRLANLSLELKQIKGLFETEKAEKEKANRILEDREKTDRISSALKEAGFAPEYHEVLTTTLKQKAILKKSEDGKLSVVVDDGTAVNDIGEYAKAFAKSDAGKPFLPRPINTSANARDFNVPPAGGAYSREDLRDPAKRKAAFAEVQAKKDVDLSR